MEKTKNYEIFKHHPSNRNIDDGSVKKLIASIKFKNLLSYRPILVDEKMRVIDGQHRLEAAKALDLDIYYNLEQNLEVEDMYLLNESQKGWGLEDYLNYYVSLKEEEYIKFKYFKDSHNLTLRVAMTAIGAGAGIGGYAGKIFKKGKFKYPTFEKECEATEIIHKATTVVNYLINHTMDGKRFFKGPRFFRALALFFSCTAIDFDLFMKKLKYKLELIRPVARVGDMLKILETIYNWNSREKVSVQSKLEIE